jgi:uncharacterized protein
MDYIQAIVIGLLGSFHCIGMCGPIALSLPLKGNRWSTKLASALLYNLGRIIVYSLLGFIFGLMGYGMSFWGIQRWISITAGVIMIFSVLFPYLVRRINASGFITKFLASYKSNFSRFFGVKSYYSIFAIGILNGFLPCGLVYIAIAGALVSNSAINGALYMMFFGLGTIPVMLLVALVGNVISLKLRNNIKKIIPVVIILIGLLFILRGLNLGIPYISPQLVSHSHPSCCH